MPAESKKPPAASRAGVDLAICFLLLVAIFAVYAQVSNHEFVSYDDPKYITDNPYVRGGLTWSGVVWAFGAVYEANWFPLTWLSHMLDSQLFGLDAGWHHLTSVAIHALSALLLFALLHRITGARWRSALVAFLFALHPLHVESVAWIAERKDVLSGFFWMATLWAYAAYAEKPRRARYALVLLLFCLGLMAKPMLVTLPVVLLLLDYWPLKRGPRILEKLPLVAASIGASLVTYLAHQKGGAVASFEVAPLAARIENALISYVVYIAKMFWPSNLAFFYPYWTGPMLVAAIFSAIALAIVTIAVVRLRRTQPYLAVGWLWYVVTLLPVIGLIQTGAQARADRYTYVPVIGLSIAVVWGAAQLLERWPQLRTALATAACAACCVLTWVQVGYWRDDVSLYQHAIAAVPNNYVARFMLASAFVDRGRPGDAVAELRETVRIRPRFVQAHAVLGQLLAGQGQPDEALRELQTAVRLKPSDADAHFRMGSVLGTLGRADEAAAEFSETIRLDPENADAHYNLGLALAERDRLPDAAREFGAAVRLRPADAAARFNYGITLAKMGRMDEAIPQFSEAVRIKPDFAEARQALDEAVRESKP